MADDAAKLCEHAPGLSVQRVEPFGAAAYLLTGGFGRWGLPWPLVRMAAAVEGALPRRMMGALALRALFVIEKR